MKPILFSTEMVQAILEGRKTLTRRAIKTPKGYYGYFICRMNDGTVTSVIAHDEHESTEAQRNCRNYGWPGDILWVRETWSWHEDALGSGWYIHKATDEDKYPLQKWKPSIHMPKEACRLFLKIKSIRVERLQEITTSDAIAEGIKKVKGVKAIEKKQYHDYSDLPFDNKCAPTESFKGLWESINGTDSWIENPHVWVIEFEQIENPENI